MNTAKHLLPLGSSDLEKKASECLREAVSHQITIPELINPDKCPVNLLPYLAWAFSVDRWEDAWSESFKRQTIKQAYYIHKKKGTINAIKRVVESIGHFVELKEWFKTKPMGVPGTFSLIFKVGESGISEELYNELIRLIEDVKPVSRHLTYLALAIDCEGKTSTFSASMEGEIVTTVPLPDGYFNVFSVALNGEIITTYS